MKHDGDGAMQYVGFSESVAYIEGKLGEHAPVHGLCGFSQVGFTTNDARTSSMPEHHRLKEPYVLDS